MLKLLTGAVSALLLSLAPVSSAAQEADPALWVMRDADTTIYLFGTSHVMKPGLGWFDGAVKSAFEASDELVLEMIEPGPEEMQAGIKRNAIAGDDVALTDKLPEAKRAKLGKVLGALGMPADGLDRFDPWLAALMISGLQLPKLGYDPALGADHVLGEAAQASGKRVVGLETVDEQFAIFNAAPHDAQVAGLVRVIDEIDRVGPIAARIMALWAAGEADPLAEVMNAELARTPALAKRLLADRNARWVEWIDTRMDRPGTIFVAVGAGHMGGTGSVRDLLKKRGFTIERVRY